MLPGWEATRCREKLPWWARGMEAGRQAAQPPLSPAWACVPSGLEGACRPMSGQTPKQPPWHCSSLRNQTQYKPLLGGILFSPLNRLEVFYIRRKTTFELVVLFSELSFVFALIKFPLTQISIKCGSHQRQTLGTLGPLFSGRRTCLCYGNDTPEWADSGRQAPSKTLPFRPCISA